MACSTNRFQRKYRLRWNPYIGPACSDCSTLCIEGNVSPKFNTKFQLLNFDTFSASVRLSQHNCNKCEVQSIQLKTAVIHEFYDSSKMTNDIALVMLKQTANIRSSCEYGKQKSGKNQLKISFLTVLVVRPVCLPLASATLNSENSRELRLTGSNFETRQTVSRTVNFLEKRKCKKNTSVQLDDRNLCVDLNDDSSIESGAVLHSLNKDNTGVIQYGIATFGGSGAAGVFLKISYYIDWILNHSE